MGQLGGINKLSMKKLCVKSFSTIFNYSIMERGKYYTSCKKHQISSMSIFIRFLDIIRS